LDDVYERFTKAAGNKKGLPHDELATLIKAVVMARTGAAVTTVRAY
jgi:hypothetical protein